MPPRSALTELQRAFKASRAGDGLLSGVVTPRLDEIATLVGIDVGRLRQLDLERPEDRDVLAAALATARLADAAARSLAADGRHVERARSLAAAARWRSGVLELPLRELFALATSVAAPVICFEMPAFAVCVRRSLLVRARPVFGRLPNPSAHLDVAGLHLRWRNGRGELNLRCPAPRACDRAAFVVRLEAPPAAPVPVVLVEVLADLDLTA